MEAVKVVIPSHKRWTSIRTTQVVDNAIICVPDSQGDIYRKCNPADEVVTHPDSVIGLQAKRNWIYKHFGSVFMIDDDISAVRRIYTDRGEPIMMEPKEVYDLIQHSADVAKQMGIYLFGFADTPNPVAYNPMKPIQLSGWVNGCAFGLLAGSGLWWDTAITCNCDYWISALNAYKHRMAYLDMRFYFNQVDTFVARGGQAEHRNIDGEERDFAYLTGVFGSDVITLKKSKNPRHPFQKTLKLPF